MLSVLFVPQAEARQELEERDRVIAAKFTSPKVTSRPSTSPARVRTPSPIRGTTPSATKPAESAADVDESKLQGRDLHTT